MSSVVVSVVSALLAPTMSTLGTGNPSLLNRLQGEPPMGSLVGFENIAVAQIDLDAPQPVSLAGLGADETTRREVGPSTKAMTGLVVVDAASRGEVHMDVPVSR